MKLVSKFALALSFAAVTAAPAFAQSDEKPKKEKKGKEATPAAPKKNYSKPFIAAYVPVANLLNKTKDAVAAKAEFPKIVAAIVGSDIDYDQLIQEFANKPGQGWTHISFSDRNRKQALIIDSQGTREWIA